MSAENMAHLRLASPDAAWPETGRRRVLLVAINMPGYYSLAVRLLALTAALDTALASTMDIRFLEADNTTDTAALARWTAALQPDLVGWSVNIWNRLPVEEHLRRLRPLLPHALFLWGGQEVTGSCLDFLALLPELDCLIEGEGELPFIQLLKTWTNRPGRLLPNPQAVSGLRFRDATGMSRLTRPADLVPSLDELPSVILAGLAPADADNLLGVLLEGARGCPNRCTFCFEGNRERRVRTAAISRLAREIAVMAERGARCFHLLDPILCNSEPARLRALAQVLDDLRTRNPRAVISVEIYAHRVTEDLIRCLKHCAIVDVGLQSAHPATAKAIRRPWQPERFAQGLARLREANIPFNLYLISGLPEERPADFFQGIRTVLADQPTRLFCNELCLLNGTELRRRAGEYGYVFEEQPPYRVLANRWMNAVQLRFVQAASKVVEKHWNLSTRAVLAQAPWLPDHPPDYGRIVYFNLAGACSLACPGCRRAEQGERSTRLEYPPESVPASVEDADVDLTAGNHTDEAALLDLLGRLRLFAPARIRLSAPPGLLAGSRMLDTLIERGLWHFRSFCPETDEATALAAAGRLAAARRLHGFAVFRPFSDVVLPLPRRLDNGTLGAYMARLRRFAACGPTVLSVPDAPLSPAWRQALAAAVPELAQKGVWLRLPQYLFAETLAAPPFAAPEAPDDAARIAEHLAALGLCSRPDAHPPCFAPQADAPPFPEPCADTP